MSERSGAGASAAAPVSAVLVPASAMVDARLADADPIGTYMFRKRRRILLVVRRHFENHVELIGLRVDRRYLPLAEGIVERVVDVLRRDAQPAGGVAVDIHQQPDAVVLLIAGHVAQFRQLLSSAPEGAEPTDPAAPCRAHRARTGIASG